MKSSFKFILCFCIAVMTISCTDKESFVENKNWKYSNGYWFGDFIFFEKKTSRIFNDTLFINEKPFAIIDKIEKRFFADNILNLRSLTENKIGRYCEK